MHPKSRGVTNRRSPKRRIPIMKGWKNPDYREVSEKKKTKRRGGKTDNPALPTRTGGSVPFSQTLARTKEEGKSLSDVHTKTKRHDRETCVSPEEQRIATEFFTFRKEVVNQNMDITEEEMRCEFVGGHNSKYGVPGIGDYEQELRPLKSSSSQSSYSQTSRARHCMSTIDASEFERLKKENRILKEQMDAIKRQHADIMEAHATIMEQCRRWHGDVLPPGPDSDGMGGSHEFRVS